MVQGLCVFGLRAGFSVSSVNMIFFFFGLLISTIFGC